MLCRRRLDTNELLRIACERDGTMHIGEGGGRGVWICRDAHEEKLRVSIQRGLRGPLRDEDVELIHQARRAWIAVESERRGT